MVIFSAISAFFGGNAQALSNAVISAASDAVNLCIRLGGTICLWGGLMAVAENSGLTAVICRLLSPFLKLIFPKMDMGGETDYRFYERNWNGEIHYLILPPDHDVYVEIPWKTKGSRGPTELICRPAP